jgi:hypothetical protein
VHQLALCAELLRGRDVVVDVRCTLAFGVTVLPSPLAHVCCCVQYFRGFRLGYFVPRLVAALLGETRHIPPRLDLPECEVHRVGTKRKRALGVLQLGAALALLPTGSR